MEISTSQFKRCDLVKVTGRIDSFTAPTLAETFNTIQESGQFKIVFDMSGVEYVSSSGLRVMINTQKACKRYNRGELVLAGVPERVMSSLNLAGFVPIFTIYDDATTAVGNF
ncbi:MAG: STAS domain-containing protein [Anaerolineaceae bacterium]